MDLTALIPRLQQQGRDNTILSFESGRIVRRTHADLYRDVRKVAEKLTAWGLKPGMRVGILAPNSYQWMVHELALIELRVVSVAFSDDFKGSNAGELCDKYMLSLLLHTRVPGWAVVPEGAPTALLDAENPEVRVADRRHEADDEQFLRMGLIFSSGSAGGVKGIVLDRRGVEGSLDSFVQGVTPRRDDCLLLFLPMSNFQQRMMYYGALWYGFDLIISEPQQIFRALKELRPTMLVAPPAFYEAFETRISNLSGWKRSLLHGAGALTSMLPGRAVRARVGRVIFKQAHDSLGGRMRLMITGMAPIKRSTHRLFARMQVPLYETYGLVECGSISLNPPGTGKRGSVGRLLPGVTVTLAPDGEILARREPTLASGYFECAPGEREKTFIGDNWIATGDIGRLDKDGYLYLVGRKKEIIVTSGGKKVHPEAVESDIDRCPDVDKSVVFHHPEQPSLVAVVLLRHPQDGGARARIQQWVNHVSGRYPSTPIETIVFTDEPFTRENGLLRPNLKLDRQAITRRFQPSSIPAKDYANVS